MLVVSGHWEEDQFTVMSSAHPPMIYDYHGFPAHTYEIRYDAPGSPETAARMRELLETAGLSVRVDDQRGYDHGTFVPLAALGAAENEKAHRIYHEDAFFGGVVVSSYRFGNAVTAARVGAFVQSTRDPALKTSGWRQAHRLAME